MKRVLVFLVLCALLGAGVGAWWLLRDTPEKVLRDALVSFQGIRTIPEAVLDVAWLNPATRATTGFTSLMQVDLKDISLPKAMGVLRIGAQQGQSQDQVLAFALDGNFLAVRPQDVSTDWQAQYAELVHTTSSVPFARMQREAFLRRFGYAGAISQEKDASMRALLPSLAPTMYAASDIERSTLDGRPIVSISVRFLRDGLQPLCIALAKAWKGTTPLTAADYAWIERMVERALAGDFRLTLDASTRQLVHIDGSSGDLRFHLDLTGVNGGVSIVLPTDVVDITGDLAPGSVPVALPVSGNRPGYVAPTSTVPVVAPSYPRDTDAFTRYYDAMKKKGLIKGAKK